MIYVTRPRLVIRTVSRYAEAMELTNKQLGQVLSTIERTGGISYHVPSGTQLASGYAVSPYPHAEQIVTNRTLTATDLADYLADYADLLSLPNHCLGVWIDPETEAAYLDVSIIVPDADTAHRVALDHDQLAYFHLDTATTTYLSI